MTLVRRPLLLLAPAAVLVVALALATNVLPLRQIIAQRQELTTTQARLDELMAENSQLDAQVDALETPIEIERIAREELGYVRPGETAFVALDPNADSKTPAAAISDITPEVAASEAEPGDRGFFAKVWDFVTGRDLATSG